MTQVAAPPASFVDADTPCEGRTISSIEMLDAIELEALIGQPAPEAFGPSHALQQWLRLWITPWLKS
jgi:hypothetical protein